MAIRAAISEAEKRGLNSTRKETSIARGRLGENGLDDSHPSKNTGREKVPEVRGGGEVADI